MQCFDVSGFATMSIGSLRMYETYWTTFNRIQAYDSNVSTLRHAGNTTLAYYQYQGYDERNAFTNGRLLHINRYPTSNWAVVEKN